MARLTTCKYCGADVFWLFTVNAKRMIIDAETFHGEPLYVAEKHRTHWGTCPYSKQIRAEYDAKKKAKEAQPPLTATEQQRRNRTNPSSEDPGSPA